MNEFKADLEAIKKRAMAKMDQGAVPEGHQSDAKKVIAVLQDALATETVCVLRYKRHYYAAKGIHGKSVEDEFLEHANEEQVHADKLARRIDELGGEPDLNPDTLTKRSHAEYGTAKELKEMIKENLVAERIAIETYLAIIQWIGDADPTTRRLIEWILEQEEEHADDMAKLLERVG